MKRITGFLLVLTVAISCKTPDLDTMDGRLMVYPNPASGVAFVHVRGTGPYNVQAFKANGKIAFNISFPAADPVYGTTYQLDLDGEGTYYVLLKINNDELRKSILSLKAQ